MLIDVYNLYNICMDMYSNTMIELTRTNMQMRAVNIGEIITVIFE